MLGRLASLTALSITLSSAACTVFGPTAEERASLAQFQERAAIYNQANRLPQALEQVRKGLEIAPNDYKLHTMRGYFLLRQANDARYATTPARRRAFLEDARAAFDATLELRSFEAHDPRLLLGDALLHEELARDLLAEKKQATEESSRRDLTPQERALQQVRVQEYDLEMRQHLARSARDLDQLLVRGDLLLFAHKHMMNVKTLLGDYAGAVEHGQSYLERCRTQQSAKHKVLETSMQVMDEQKAAQELSGLVDDELTVRSQLADLHFDKQRYDLAIKELDRILELDPGRAADYYNRARALCEAERYDDAYRDVQKFLAMHTLPAGHASLVKAHDMLRKLDERRR